MRMDPPEPGPLDYRFFQDWGRYSSRDRRNAARRLFRAGEPHGGICILLNRTYRTVLEWTKDLDKPTPPPTPPPPLNILPHVQMLGQAHEGRIWFKTEEVAKAAGLSSGDVVRISGAQVTRTRRHPITGEPIPRQRWASIPMEDT